MNELTHLDTFSGLGGFALAARAAGFKTLAFCESDARCRRFLQKTWGLSIHDDIKTLDGTRYRGVTLLTGGPPCQPSSRAGQQRGEDDDRWLWDEALRVLAEALPLGVVFENPAGILDVGIDGILTEMERIGYAVQPFDIPACAVDSPQIRSRYWLVGFLDEGSDVAHARYEAESSAQPEPLRERRTGTRKSGGELADRVRDRRDQEVQRDRKRDAGAELTPAQHSWTRLRAGPQRKQGT